MQGSVAISPSPVIMESLIFRQKLGLCLSPSVNQINTSSSTSGCAATARCLFGPPDPKQAKDLVREVELKNALNFGKRYNFDIVAGEPFPNPKKMRMSPGFESDEENVAMSEEEDGDGYIWAETYEQDFMAMCNKEVVSGSVVGPNRHAVTLLFAPVMSNHRLYSSALSPKTSISSLGSPGAEQQNSSDESGCSPSSATDLARSSSETNNNISSNKNQNEKKSTERQEKRNNRVNSIHHRHPAAKKSTLASAHQILTKYTNRVLKHAVMKKPQKSVITDYLQMRRMKNGLSRAGKK